MKTKMDQRLLVSGGWLAKLYRWIVYKPQYLFVTIGSFFVFLLTITSLVTVLARRTGLGGAWAAGGNDVAEALMSMIVPMGLAYCWYLGGHVRIGVIRDRLSSRGQAIIDALTTLTALVWVAIMSWSTLGLGLFNIKTNFYTRMLEIPVGPLQIIFSIIMAQFVLVLFVSLVAYVAQIVKPVEKVTTEQMKINIEESPY